jgi:hypothetical protein
VIGDSTTGVTMNPNQDRLEPDPANQSAGTGANGGNGSGPRPGPPLIPVTPEIVEWMLHQGDDEMAAAGLREIEETGGLRFEDFLPELKRAAGIDD